MDRKDVYRLINEEREYQEILPDTRTDGHQHQVGEELVLLQVYTQRALNSWVDNPGDLKALCEIRKVAAIAVRCLENHGSLKVAKGYVPIRHPHTSKHKGE